MYFKMFFHRAKACLGLYDIALKLARVQVWFLNSELMKYEIGQCRKFRGDITTVAEANQSEGNNIS